MISDVLDEYPWEPAAIGRLFYDRVDYMGLLFWYDRARAKKKAKQNQRRK